MATVSNALTALGERIVYRQLEDKIGILVSEYSHPRCLLPGAIGRKLGLHYPQWHTKAARHSGTATYYVRIVPIWSSISDPDGLPLMGTPSTESATGTTFTWDPYPDGYPCDGYRVYAGTVSGTLYYQGTLANRFITTYTVGTTFGAYSALGAVLGAQTIGPPAFATAVEVYQAEGQIDARIFLGGGKNYSTGYAQVAKADAAPVLTCGVDGEQTFGDWAAVTAGSFRMRLAWTATFDYDEWFDWTGINFGSCGNMADVAALFQTTIRAAKHPVLYGGTGRTTTVATWAAIAAGSFEFYVDGTLVQVTAIDFTGDTTMADVAASIQTRLQAIGGVLAAATCTYDTTAARFVLRANNGSATAASTLSYLWPHASGTGTDISDMMDCRETSNTAVLNRRGKAATTAETATWSTDHLVFTSTSTGNKYRFSFMQAATADVGTDVSVLAFADGRSTSNTATYAPGKTAKRTVFGYGTTWGDWARGMRFRIQDETAEYLVADYYDTDHLLLDSDYLGCDALNNVSSYVLIPYDQQVYLSALGNPFKFSPGDITPLPTADGDALTAIKRNGSNVAAFMKHHVWFMDGVNLQNPKMFSNTEGASTAQCLVEYGSGIAWFNGQTFKYLNEGRIVDLDPQNRTAGIVGRISANAPYRHGVYDNSDGRDYIIWYVGLDSTYYYSTAIVYEPKTGNFWLYNVKDALSSCVIRDTNDDPWLVIGTSYDAGHSIPAFILKQRAAYLNDGASSDSTTTKQGTINSVGNATTTAGYLTCGKARTQVTTWQAVTAGYFQVTIDDTSYNVGPMNFSGISALTGLAAIIQAAIRTQTGLTETVTWSTDHIVITSSTTTSRSAVSALRSYFASGGTDISGRDYLNGRAGTETGPVTQRVLNVYTMSGGTPTLATSGDGEKNVWVYVCDTNGENGQWAKVVSNTATALTVSPNFTTAPAAGWYWFLGGIVPSWTKWFDFGSPQHRHQMHGIAITVVPETGTTGNRVFVHGMQDLSSAIRTHKVFTIGGTADVTNTIRLSDKPANQHGVRVFRPSSEYGLTIEDITIEHRAKV
jgi:hypothetical protein